jgi:surfeit locus 1 family protein
MPLLVALGVWQLHRADEKRAIQQEVAKSQAQPAVPLSALIQMQSSPKRYRKAFVSGQWESQVFLLDNQMENGRVGYQVVGVFKLENGSRLLVNRGWMAMDLDRAHLPDVPLAESDKEIGEIYWTDELLKDELIYAEVGWPRRIQRLHLPALSKESNTALLPFMLRLDKESPSALTVNWPAINMLPEKHQAYAIQWFAMAIALLVFYLVLGLRGNATQTQ